jgi:hypothetical protein
MNETAELQRTTITVNAIEPAQGRKSGRIKAEDGTIYGAWPNKIGLFREGESYEIDYAENDRGNVIFRDIRSARHLATFRGPKEETQRMEQMRGTFTEITAPKITPKPKAAANGFYKATSPADAERMFVCKILGDFIATGRVEFTRENLVHHIEVLRGAWQDTFENTDSDVQA